MAINKVVNKSTKSHGAMRNVIQYVLQNEKVKEGYVEITGPYVPDTITCDEVYKTFLDEKKLWNKDTGRMYAHNIISFHKEEKITPEECLEIGRRFSERFFSGFQNLIGVHQDREHLHVHIITNTVSFIDGMKLHQTKRDLEYQKSFTNDICRQQGLHIAEKGKHYDGSVMEEGELIAWNKDKYNLLLNESKKSFVTECAIAVMESKEDCSSREEFIERMLERGWHTIWTDTKKHITFQNDTGNKVRDTNLSKTFSLNISKETLTHEFKRQNESIETTNEQCITCITDSGNEFEQYYRELESAVAGAYHPTVTGNPYAAGPGSRSAGNDTDTFLSEIEAREKSSGTKRDDSIAKRDDSIAKRKDREVARERSRIERERDAEDTNKRSASQREENTREMRSSHRSR